MGEEWNIDCSDDELKDCKGEWEPPSEEVNRLYNQLDNDEIPELKWKCPGYRSPSPDVSEEVEETIEHKIEDIDKSDFDFQEDVMSPKLKIRKDGEEVLKGSAKKKTTSLDGVLHNMRRHNILPPKATD